MKLKLEIASEKINITWILQLNTCSLPDFGNRIPKHINQSLNSFMSSGQSMPIIETIKMKNKINPESQCTEQNDEWMFLVFGFERNNKQSIVYSK
jgi:hypothetical protein